MSKIYSRTSSVPRPSIAPFVVQIDGVSAGLAVGEQRGFRFIAAHPRFNLLDGSHFRRLEDVKGAAKRLAHASRK